MPVLSWGHSQYWSNQPQSSGSVDVITNVGYPAWQASVIVGGGFGATQLVWEWFRDRRRTTTEEPK